MMSCVFLLGALFSLNVNPASGRFNLSSGLEVYVE